MLDIFIYLLKLAKIILLILLLYYSETLFCTWTTIATTIGN